MKIGTLSFERRGNDMALPSNQRVSLISEVFSEHRPDLLLCAGWSVDTLTDLKSLERILKPRLSSSIVAVEVRHGDGGGERDGNFGFLLECDGAHGLGRQMLVTSADAKNQKIAEFVRCFPDKIVRANGKTFVNLCCGEINIVSGRLDPKPIALGDNLLSADIVLNPTHDRMGNGGTLNAKRAWLSQKIDGRERVYVSASNWNTNRNGVAQKPSANTLHTVYVSGVRQRMSEPAGIDRGYVYREFRH